MTDAEKLEKAINLINLCETNLREIALLVSNESLAAANNLLKELLIEFRRYREGERAYKRAIEHKTT